MEKEKLTDIVSLFNIEGTVCEIKPLGEGLINDTFRVITAEEDKPNYVLQRVNHIVFPDVDMVMRNIQAVTSHIRKKLEESNTEDIDRRVLTFIPSKENADKLYCVVDGQYWRIMVFIPNAITKQAVNPDSSRAAGKAFGEFQAMLADIPVSLGETIKDFHNMEFRLQQLRDVIASDQPDVYRNPRYRKCCARLKNARKKCARQNAWAAKAHCPNAYATVTPR
jgi:hypothetical protein